MKTQVEAHSLPNDASVLLARDDLYCGPGGARGGKARTCEALLAGRESTAVVTAGSRASTSPAVIAAVAFGLGYDSVRVHTPAGEPGAPLREALELGAERVVQTPGYRSVLWARAREDAEERDAELVPFGMECSVAAEQTARAVGSALPALGLARRLIVPVGSGMTLAGVLLALNAADSHLPVIGVVMGADPTERLNRFAPFWRWRDVELVPSGLPYAAEVEADIDGVDMNPVYEAKCVRFMRAGDALWMVGRRQGPEET